MAAATASILTAIFAGVGAAGSTGLGVAGLVGGKRARREARDLAEKRRADELAQAEANRKMQMEQFNKSLRQRQKEFEQQMAAETRKHSSSMKNASREELHNRFAMIAQLASKNSGRASRRRR